MKTPFLLFILLLQAVPVWAQTTLQIEGTERGFFACGATLTQGAFAYAGLAKQAAQVSKTRDNKNQLTQLGELAPLAKRDREQARDDFSQASTLMQSLDAPLSALAPVSNAAARLSRPLVMTVDVRQLAAYNSDAAYTLSAIDEFGTLSAVPENPAVRGWLASSKLPHSAHVWFGEGEITALIQIAAAQQMPELLPSAEQLATDLRGLRDWLALRLPDAPSPDQSQLKADLDAFLQSRKPLASARLQALGDISRRLQAQILNSPTVAAPGA